MSEIKLNRGAWTLDESDMLGPPGGFGEVFSGRGPDGPVAVKRLKLTASAAADREMKIGSGLADRPLKHVVPILDYGQDAESDRYYLVMPACDRSLQDYLNSAAPLVWDEARAIILDVISGLLEVRDIVHRDLKPGNVLQHEGTWKIADFGIAKFVEDSTSLETLRNSLTPAYGAPEQWLGERPTSATDVYALGCIIHAMLNGAPPFGGDVESIREAHLRKQPPALTGMPARLDALVTTMLRKSASSRPSLERCSTVILTIEAQPPRPAHAALAAAGRAAAQREAEAEAKQRAEDTIRRERKAIGEEAISQLHAMMSALYDQIEQLAETARREKRTITLGSAKISYSDPEYLGSGRWRGNDPYDNGLDIVAWSELKIQAQVERHSISAAPTYTFSATLVFSTTSTDKEYRWREVSFWSFGSDRSVTPFALRADDREFGVALSNTMGTINVAHGPLTMDAEDEESFYDRWLTLFSKAAQSKLMHPMTMPPPPSFFQ